MDPFTIVYDALLRPTRFAASLDSGRRAIVRAALAVLLWVGAALAFVGLILVQLAPLGVRGLVAGLALAPAMALLIAGLGVMVGGSGRSTLAQTFFWVLRCQIAITPPLALFMALTFSQAFASLQRSPAIALLFLVMVGMWLGGGLTVILTLREHQNETLMVRWVVAGGALAIGAALWLSPPLRASSALLFIPFCAGLTAGLIRPLSYFWELPTSLALALLARLGANPLRLLALHPVSYDDLCLLPLPGLSGLLIRGCAAELEMGGEWLLCVADHPGQRRAAERAIMQIVRRGQLAHPLLFWLSTSDAGPALLSSMAERGRGRSALIGAYATFAAVPAPESWSEALHNHRHTLAQAVALPGGQAMLALVDAGLDTLRADRWRDAIAHLAATPPPGGVVPDPIWAALETVQAWADSAPPADVAERAAAVGSLMRALEDLEGWPIALIATLCEHLLFLIGIEQRRGAWLV